MAKSSFIVPSPSSSCKECGVIIVAHYASGIVKLYKQWKKTWSQVSGTVNEAFTCPSSSLPPLTHLSWAGVPVMNWFVTWSKRVRTTSPDAGSVTLQDFSRTLLIFNSSAITTLLVMCWCRSCCAPLSTTPPTWVCWLQVTWFTHTWGNFSLFSLFLIGYFTHLIHVLVIYFTTSVS